MRFNPLAMLACAAAVDGCCCCDINLNAIVCVHRPAYEGCFCPAVVCPQDASTIYINDAYPTSTSIRSVPGTPTRCLEPSTFATSGAGASRRRAGRMVRRRRAPEVTPQAPMPPPRRDADGADEAKEATPTTRDGNEEEAKAEAKRTVGSGARLAPCCCCNVASLQTVCRMAEAGDCYCAAVVCPEGAPTVWIDSAPCSTSAT
ncbi:hypothetical protein RJ55_03055 [Drechmeria coniospora]|nr:hypothetical protein RJ55_03055 [Drechmeria coniospora]